MKTIGGYLLGTVIGIIISIIYNDVEVVTIDTGIACIAYFGLGYLVALLLAVNEGE